MRAHTRSSTGANAIVFADARASAWALPCAHLYGTCVLFAYHDVPVSPPSQGTDSHGSTVGHSRTAATRARLAAYQGAYGAIARGICACAWPCPLVPYLYMVSPSLCPCPYMPVPIHRCELSGQMMVARVPGSVAVRVDGHFHGFNVKAANLSHTVRWLLGPTPTPSALLTGADL